jgi:hypothetical protein
MSNVGENNDHAGNGATVSDIADGLKRRRRSGDRGSARSSASEPADPDAGTGLLPNLDLGFDGELLVAKPVDDVLDDILGRHMPPSARDADLSPAAGLERLDVVSGPRESIPAYDEVQAQIERHHQRHQPARIEASPRGSADLAARIGRRPQRRHAAFAGKPSLRRIVAIGLISVGVAIVGLVLATRGGKTAGAATLRGQSLVTIGNPFERTLGVVGTSASAIAAAAERADRIAARAQTRARGRARVARRDRPAARLKKRRSNARVEATSVVTTPPASSTVATSTVPAYSTGSTPISSPAPVTDTPSSKPRDSSSGSASQPAGPTGVGSTGGSNCNPKCS